MSWLASSDSHLIYMLLIETRKFQICNQNEFMWIWQQSLHVHISYLSASDTVGLQHHLSLVVSFAKSVMTSAWQWVLGVDSEMFLYKLLLCSLRLVEGKISSAQEALEGERQTLIVIMQGQSGSHAEDEGFSVWLLRGCVFPSDTVCKPV